MSRLPLIFALLWAVACSRGPESRCAQTFTQTNRLLEQGEAAKARALLESSLDWAPEPCASRLRSNLVDSLINLRQYDPALPLTAETAGADAETQFRLRLSRGYLTGLAKRYEEADRLLSASLTEAEKSRQPAWIAATELRRGTIATLRNRPAEAETHLRRALENLPPKDQKLGAEVNGALGFLLFRQDRLAQAEYYLARSLEYALASGNQLLAARTRGNLGMLYLRYGEPLRARDSLTAAEQKARELGGAVERVGWLQNLGNAQYQLRNLQAASVYFEQALEEAERSNSPETQAGILYNLTALALEQGQLDRARQLNQRTGALFAQTRRPLGGVLIGLRNAQLARRQDRAAEAGAILARLASEPDLTPWLRMTIESERAYAADRLNEAEAATQHYEAALAIAHREQSELDSPSQLTYGSAQTPLHQSYVEFLVRQKRYDRALEMTEWGRTQGPCPRLSAAQLAGLAGRLNAAILTYWTDAKEAYVWVITSTGHRFLSLPQPSPLRVLVQEYEEQLGLPPEKQTAAQALFARLIAPALPEYARKGRFVIIPDGPLHRISFDALRDGAGRYWLENAAIVVARSLESAGRVLPNKAMGEPRILLAGNPVSPVREFPALPNSARELERLQQLFPQTHTVLAGGQATVEGYFVSHPEEFTYLHFSTHSTANPKRPSESALILSLSASGYQLTAEAIRKLPVKAQVVSLATCQSAGAHLSSGALMGVAWGFLEAGAGNVLASLNKVADESAAELSVYFYEALKQSAGPAEALQVAKLRLKAQKGFEAASHWAPYVMLR